MEKQTIKYLELKGTSTEIGRELARRPEVIQMCVPAPELFTNSVMEEALQLYERYCPGIVEELSGFSEESKIAVKDLAYSWMTYLIPRCCGIALQGSRMKDGHTRLARSYEFGIEEEDLTVCRTSVSGKYAHIGATTTLFGRSEGINEHGLAVSQSSCGFPVSNLPQMRNPGIKGLQFWAVIRSLLENCKTVDEALSMLEGMPIAYNINLYLADATGEIVLYETMNGEPAYERIGAGNRAMTRVKIGSEEKDLKKDDRLAGCLFGTNHIAIQSFQNREPVAMKNSLVRQEKIEEFLQQAGIMTEEELREFLLTKYPAGPMSYYFDEWFGTVRSVVMDVEERRYSVCWLGQKENGWDELYVNQELDSHQKEAVMEREFAEPGTFDMIPIPQIQG